MSTITYQDVRIEFLGHSSFKIETRDTVIYTDPYRIDEVKMQADLILISHGHYDHCDQKDIDKVSKQKTIIITPEDSLRKIKGNLQKISQHETLNMREIKISSIPAYNINKPYHPKGLGIGYIIDTGRTRIYFAGDTDYVEEMDNLTKIDIALVPIGGTYTMDEKEAASFINNLEPKIVIPMHYGIITSGNPQKFKSMINTRTKVEIMK